MSGRVGERAGGEGEGTPEIRIRPRDPLDWRGDRGENPGGGGEMEDAEVLIERLLDGESSAAEREALMRALREHPELAEELARLRAVLGVLRGDAGESPDLSGAILGEIGRRRGFVGRTFRHLGSTARAAALVALLVGVGAVAWVQGRSPEVVVRAAPTPVTHVVDAFEREVGDVREAVDQAEAAVRREFVVSAGEFRERLGGRTPVQILSFGSGAEVSVSVAVDARGVSGAPSVMRSAFEPGAASWEGLAPASPAWVSSTWEGGAVVVVDGRERLVRSTMAMQPRGFVVTPTVARRAQFDLGQGAGLP